jgi:hypothetical protein
VPVPGLLIRSSLKSFPANEASELAKVLPSGTSQKTPPNSSKTRLFPAFAASALSSKRFAWSGKSFGSTSNRLKIAVLGFPENYSA